MENSGMKTLVRRLAPLLVPLVLLALSFGCASSGTGSGDAAPAASAPAARDLPAKKPFEPPAFDSTEFVSQEHGFRIHYPSDFQVSEPQSPTGLLTAASPMMAPRVDVNYFPSPGGLISLDQGATLLEQQMSQIGGGEAKVTHKEEIDLQDGVTPGLRYTVEWTMQGFPLTSIVVLAPQGDETINVTVTGLQGGEIEDLTRISDTLYIE